MSAKQLCFFILHLLPYLYFANLDARLYFLHVPKTGGITLRVLLEQQVSAEEIHPLRNYRQKNLPMTKDVISGHFPYWFCKQSDETFADAFKVTVLRDPVERCLSFLRYQKKIKSLPDLESVMNRSYSIGLQDNIYCRFLAEDPDLEGDALLESAKKTLHQLDCVILFDSFSRDVIKLFKRLGIELQEHEIPRMNTTEKEPISPELLEKVRKLTILDIQLYEYAKTNLQEKEGSYQLRTKSFEGLLKKTDTVDYTFNLPLNGRGWTFRGPLKQQQNKIPIHRWVMKEPSYIYFPLTENLDYDLYIEANCLTEDVTPIVKVNGKQIELQRLNHQLFSKYWGVIPKEYLTEGPTELSFHSSLTFYHKDIYPKSKNYINLHPISFAVSRIKICKKS